MATPTTATSIIQDPNAAPLIRAVDVTKHFGSVVALDRVSLNVMRGEVCCIIGSSGSGKSTFLRCINMLERIDGGAIWLNEQLVGYRSEGTKLYELRDHEIARQRRRVGMVFQRFNLFPHLTVLQNVMEGPVIVLKEPVAQVREHALDLLGRVGLADKANAYPAQLSGGQQQRVAIARALCMKPELMLFDEPTSALDPELVAEVLTVMRDLADSGMTMMVVTHELGFARDVADTVVFMQKGQVVEAGSADAVLNHPTHAQTIAFMGAVRK